MSWEEIRSTSHPCPCGKGHYTVTLLSDDWNRFDDSWAMICPRCKNSYSLYSYTVNRRGQSETCRTWAPKVLLKELAALRKGIDAEKSQIADYLQNNYASRWRQHFSGKTKKAIWGELTEYGQRYPGLATFYTHVRFWGLEKSLYRYLDYRELATVRRVLQINDSALNSATNNIESLEQAAGRLHQRMTRPVSMHKPLILNNKQF